MSSARPKRVRKIVSYNEDHVHWKEEKQLQKVLLRSLKEKNVPQSGDVESNYSSMASDDAMQLSSATVELTQLENTFVLPEESITTERDILNSSTSSDDSTLISSSIDPSLLKDESCVIRLTRLQTKLLEEAGMVDFDTSDYNPDAERAVTPTPGQSVEDKQDDPAPKMRAQRKFASNSSSPQSRSESPVKMHRQKVHARKWNGKKQEVRLSPRVILRPVRACPVEEPIETAPPVLKRKKGRPKKNSDKESTVKKPKSLLPGMPKTDSFLTYLCFRNTSVKVNLIDCAK